MTCTRAQEFLGRKKIVPRQSTDAKRERLGATEVLSLVEEMHELYVAKGDRIVHVNLQREPPDRDTLLKLLLGPSGNLRAPSLRVGKKLLVGFTGEMYETVLGGSAR